MTRVTGGSDPCMVAELLFIVRADLASGRDFHLAAERAELSDFEFYCIFEGHEQNGVKQGT